MSPTRSYELFHRAVTTDEDGEVTAVDGPLALQAIELHRSMGESVRGLLESALWFSRPDLLFSIVCPREADFNRECYRHAIWCTLRASVLSPLPSDGPFSSGNIESILQALADAVGRGEPPPKLERGEGRFLVEFAEEVHVIEAVICCHWAPDSAAIAAPLHARRAVASTSLVGHSKRRMRRAQRSQQARLVARACALLGVE